MKSTNRTWQSHLKTKGIIGFFLDRLHAHALSSEWQHPAGVWDFNINDREIDDELSRAYFKMTETFPYDISLEITNLCNLNCKMCARQVMTRKQGVMDDKLFKKIIDEISEQQPYAYVHFYGVGESLLDPDIFKKLAYAHAKGIHNSVLFTNGQLLTDDQLCEKLAYSGVSTIGVDLDGFSEDTYRQIRVGGSYRNARQAIETLYGITRRDNLDTKIEIAYQVYTGINDHEVEHFVQWCEANKYEYKIVTMHNWAGLRNDIPVTEINGVKDEHHGTRNCPCPNLWKITIGWDGRVGLCFQDANFQHVLGDLNTESISEVWQKLHLDKRKEQLNGIYTGLCKDCNSSTTLDLPGKGSSLYPENMR
jgi:MoaA/NifB/PqqE/SkfB family radical SAM enzyme